MAILFQRAVEQNRLSRTLLCGVYRAYCPACASPRLFGYPTTAALWVDEDVGHAGTIHGVHGGGQNADFARRINANQGAGTERGGEGKRWSHLRGERTVGVGWNLVHDHGANDAHEASVDG